MHDAKFLEPLTPDRWSFDLLQLPVANMSQSEQSPREKNSYNENTEKWIMRWFQRKAAAQRCMRQLCKEGGATGILSYHQVFWVEQLTPTHR
jgi:hypothetical protein